MTTKTFSRLSQYGNVFQIKILSSLLTNKNLLVNVRDTIEPDYFDNDSHKWIVETIIKYFDKYHTIPTVDTLHVEVKKIENDVIKIAVKEQLKEAYKASEEDLQYVNEEFSNFCKNQQLKKALIESVDLLNLGAYDDIRRLIDQALKAGEDKNVGHIYAKDIESRYRDDDRSPIPFPWKTFNDLTQGGMGKGDLILMFGNPGGGKSWAVTACGAYAAYLGYNVLHYTLELAEGYVGKRYDACFTGIPVDQLKERKKEVEKWFEDNPIKGEIVIKEYAPRRASFDTLESHLNQLELQYNFVPHLIIIDYLDYLKTTSRKERKEEIDDVYVAAKGLAKARQIPVLSPSQANRTGANNTIIEGENVAGSYDKIMIGDILISLARNRQNKIDGDGMWHFIKNRYGADGLTFSSKMDTSNGKIEIDEHPFDIDSEDSEDEKEIKTFKNSFSNLNKGDIKFLGKKFLDNDLGK
jgi:replicative DNA helicase